LRAVRAGIRRALLPALSAKREASLPILDTYAEFILVLRVEFDEDANGRDRFELTRPVPKVGRPETRTILED
jgi:hypothetical protein